jgi:hypothetical protein
MKRTLLAASSLAVLATFHAPPAGASSHREAPMIAGMPKLDATDFYMFRAYEPGHSANVVMIADYIPLQDPYGGPNFFYLDHTGYYDINIDSKGAGVPDKTFRFRFSDVENNLTLPVGGMNVPIPLINAGPVTATDKSAVNRSEKFTVSLVTYDSSGKATETPLANPSGRTIFNKPLDDIGMKSIADYGAYAAAFQYQLNIPGCTGHAVVYVGQRKDPFVANLGETFDLVNYANPVGEQFANTTRDDLALKNVTSLILEVPASCLVNGTDPVIGGYTTATMGTTSKSGKVTYTQVSRLGNPLVNELVIGLPDKDKFNGSTPKNDGQFAQYVTNPTVPALIQALFNTPAPTAFPRTDLEAVFLTGIAGVNQPAKPPVASEEMRLNTSIPITPYGSQNRLGVIAGDNAGYPNGRRPGDDVVDITLRVAMGRLYTLGLFGVPSDAPSGALDFTDGAYVDDTHFLNAFPYVNLPIPGSPQSAY